MTFAFKCICGHEFDESFVELDFGDGTPRHRPMRRDDADAPQRCPACGELEGRYHEAGNLVGVPQFKRDALDVEAEETGAPITCKVAAGTRRRAQGAGVRRFIQGAEGRLGGWDATWV